jgi:small subunit ribosomal protein S17
MRERKKELVGRVVSDRMDKTVVVAVNQLRRHRLYQRMMRQTKKFMAHDESNNVHVGDLVRIQESRPISRHKTWRVINVLEEAARRGKAVDMPVVAATAGVPNVEAIANADVTPGILPGTEAESDASQEDAESTQGQEGQR